MDFSFNGLPLHILIVHAVVIVVPVAAIVVLLAAVWPRARRWFGLVTPILGVVAAALVYVAKEAGEWLEGPPARLPAHPEARRARRHPAAVGDRAGRALRRRSTSGTASSSVARRTRPRRRWCDASSPIVLAVAAVVVVPAGIVTTVIIGESGSRAVWEGSFSDTPLDK